MSKKPNIPAIEDVSEEIARSFNAKPKEGIKMLIGICASNGIENPEEQIALFFHKNRDNLDLEAVGDYLGTESKEHAKWAREKTAWKKDKSQQDPGEEILGQNEKVLKYFAGEMNFKEKDFLPAMREYLTTFSLPGEGQKIGRIMESFGQRYHEENPGKFQSPDGAVILAFSSVMLSTDQHNPNIKPEKKMTLEGFIRNNRGIDAEKDIKREILDGIYTDIQSKPLGLRFERTTPTISFETPRKGLKTATKAIRQRNSNLTEERTAGILGKLFGYKNTITIEGENGAKVKVETSKPGLFSRKKSTATIQPVESEAKVSDSALTLAASIASSFRSEPTSIKTAYSYQEREIEDGMQKPSKDKLEKTRQQFDYYNPGTAELIRNSMTQRKTSSTQHAGKKIAQTTKPSKGR